MKIEVKRMLEALPCLDPDRNGAVDGLWIVLAGHNKPLNVNDVEDHRHGLWSARLADDPKIEVVFTPEQLLGFYIVRNQKNCSDQQIFTLDELIDYGERA